MSVIVVHRSAAEASLVLHASVRARKAGYARRRAFTVKSAFARRGKRRKRQPDEKPKQDVFYHDHIPGVQIQIAVVYVVLVVCIVKILPQLLDQGHIFFICGKTEQKCNHRSTSRIYF